MGSNPILSNHGGLDGKLTVTGLITLLGLIPNSSTILSFWRHGSKSRAAGRLTVKAIAEYPRPLLQVPLRGAHAASRRFNQSGESGLMLALRTNTHGSTIGLRHTGEGNQVPTGRFPCVPTLEASGYTVGVIPTQLDSSLRDFKNGQPKRRFASTPYPIAWVCDWCRGLNCHIPNCRHYRRTSILSGGHIGQNYRGYN